MLSPSEVEMASAFAVRLKVLVGLVIPSTSASATGGNAAIAAARNTAIRIVVLMDRLLASGADDDFGHHSPEILGVIAQVVEVRGVDEVGARRDGRGVEQDVHTLSSGEREGPGRVRGVEPAGSTEQLRSLPDDAHGNAEHRHRVERFGRQAGDAEEQLV